MTDPLLKSHEELREAFVALLVERNHLQARARGLLAELAEHYPVSSTARAVAEEADEHATANVRELVDVIAKIRNSTAAAKLEYLPQRLREVTP